MGDNYEDFLDHIPGAVDAEEDRDREEGEGGRENSGPSSYDEIADPDSIASQDDD